MTMNMSTLFADHLEEHSGVSVIDAIGGGTFVCYSGTPPANADAALSGNTVLATFTFSAAASQPAPASKSFAPAFAATTVTAAATGTATFFRLIDASANVLAQGTIGTSGADLDMSSVSWSSGDPITLSSGTLSFP